MTSKDLLLILVGLFSLLHCLNYKRENIIFLTILLVPIGTLFDSSIIPIGLTGILIWSIWFSIIIKRNNIGMKVINWKEISPKLLWLYLFIFLGLIIGLINVNSLDTYTKESQFTQVFRLTMNILTIVFFIKILVNYRTDITFQKKIKYIFTLSIFIHLIPIIAEKIGILNRLVAISYTTFEDSLIHIEVSRFSGLFFDYELIIDYCLIIIGLSLSNILQNQRKKFISFLTILIALFIGLKSGTRSFLIILPIFFISFYMLSLLFSIYRRKFTVFFLTLLGLVYFFVIKFSSQIIIFERLFEAKKIYSSTGNLNEASNRNFGKSIISILENVTPIGNGSLAFNQIKGDEMVCHNLLMHTYARYGIPGLLLLLILFLKSTVSILKNITKSKSKIQKLEGIILASLLISLFIQEMKISAIRYQHSMLIYVFLFMQVYYYLYQFKNKKLNG
jgi:hypothetical protein